MARTPRTDAEIRKDLEVWEKQLDLHLQHCELCNEGSEVYCKTGSEISFMVTSLLMEQVRAGIARQEDERTGGSGLQPPQPASEGERS